MGKREMTSAPPKTDSEHSEAQVSRDALNDYWQDEVLRARKRSKDWRYRANETVRTYRGIIDDDLETFNILWSNTETLKGAIYSRTPVPEVTRRFYEDDREGNTMAMVMERCLTYCQGVTDYDFDRAMELARDDYLLTGRGVVRVRYAADFEEEATEGYQELSDGTVEFIEDTVEKKTWEEVYLEHVPWDDFEHSYGKAWVPDVWWEGFARDMTRDDLVGEFGPEVGNEVPLNGQLKHDDWDDWSTDDRLGSDSAGFYNWYDREDYARVWELWDKRSGKVIWIAEAAPKVLRVDDDPYGLPGFFPAPEPIYSLKTSNTLEPVPEYTQYQYQATELNIITRRLTNLTDALKAVGVCDSEIHALSQLFDAPDNTIIADEEFSKLMANGGTDGAIAWLPLATISDVIGKLSARRAEVKEEIYELTGIADILRGQSDPRETATAVKTKGKFGTLRIQQRQKAIQKLARDSIRLMGSLVAELFDSDTLILMSGVEDRPEVVEGMEAMVEKFRDSAMRDYTIDIETDSTIAINEAEQKAEVGEFFTAFASLMQQLVPAVSQGILPMPAAKAMMKYAANRYNAGRDLSEAIDMIGSKPGKPQEDPAQQAQQQAAQAKMAIEQAKLKLAEAELQFKQQEAQVKAKLDMAKLNIEYQKLGMDFESTRMQEEVKIITAKMDIQAARENRVARGAN